MLLPPSSGTQPASVAASYGLGVVLTFVEITERKEAEENLRRSKIAAEQANQAKDQFLANVSHELRTPLSAILLWAKTLGKETVGRGGDGERGDGDDGREKPSLGSPERRAAVRQSGQDDLVPAPGALQDRFQHPLHRQAVAQRGRALGPVEDAGDEVGGDAFHSVPFGRGEGDVRRRIPPPVRSVEVPPLIRVRLEAFRAHGRLEDPAVAAGTSESLISEASIRAMYRHWRAEMGL